MYLHFLHQIFKIYKNLQKFTKFTKFTKIYKIFQKKFAELPDLQGLDFHLIILRLFDVV